MSLYIILLLLSLILTFIIRKIAAKRNIIDIPNERSSHSTPTPRGGGLAIVITWFGGLVYLFTTDMIESNLFYALISGSILAIVSLIDDIIDLSPKIRLLAQAFSAFGALYFLNGFDFHIIQQNHSLINVTVSFFTIIGIIWFINLFNFLDGIDAYASIESIFISLGLFLLSGNSTLLILIVTVLGFLFWNWPKAKIFMGDVGSTQLGFILIVLAIYFHNNNSVNIVYWLMLSSVFWFDATITIFRRWRNKEKLSQAHKKHVYQRFVQVGNSHLKTVLYTIGLNALILLLVLLANYFNTYKYLFLIIDIALLYLITRIVDYLFPFKK